MIIRQDTDSGSDITADGRDSRTLSLLGPEAMRRLSRACVLVAGAGGVGGYVAETLVRSGIGSVWVADADIVAESNLNRQLIATRSTIGMYKADAWRQRLSDIRPDCAVECRKIYIDADNVGELLGRGFDFVADCIDTVAPKVALLRECVRRKMRVVSSMGAGGRLDPSRVKMGDLWQTREDGLARAVRQGFKRSGEHPRIRVVWSDETPRRAAVIGIDGTPGKRSSYGTLATIPAIFGLWMANHIIRELAACDSSFHNK